MIKCQLCSKKVETEHDLISITDSETEQEVMVCFECDNKLFTPIGKGYTDLTLQQIDEQHERDFEYYREQKAGLI